MVRRKSGGRVSAQAAVEEHLAIVQPLNDELANLDAQRVDAIVKRKDYDANGTIADRRREILSRITAANTSLALTQKANETAKGNVLSQSRKLHTAASQAPVLRNLLVELADPVKLAHCQALTSRSQWAAKRHDFARGWVERLQGLILNESNAGNKAVYGRRLFRRKAELKDAAELPQKATEEAEAYRERLQDD